MKRQATDTFEPQDSQFSLSNAEHSVLGVFRNYLMTPEKMLCFSSLDLKTLKKPLDQLASKGLLVADQHGGAYSLTKIGFAVMRKFD